MKILGISPLDKDATVSIVEDGKILYAAGEERFTRVKQQDGFPHEALKNALAYTNTSLDEIDHVAYAFTDAQDEKKIIDKNIRSEAAFIDNFKPENLSALLEEANRKKHDYKEAIHGLKNPNEQMEKGFLHELFYKIAGTSSAASRIVAKRGSQNWADTAVKSLQYWQTDLEKGLSQYGLETKIKRMDHHMTHAANSFITSGYERALCITLDGYGTGLAGSVSEAANGKIRRLHGVKYPSSLGTLYEHVTSSLGFKPSRHEGKIVGLASYGDPDVLSDILLSHIQQGDGDFRIFGSNNIYLSRYLAANFSKIDVAAAYQHVLEVVAVNFVKYWVKKTGIDTIVLSGGVTANVKLNQRIFEIEAVKNIFVYPNMGDGGCGSGAAMYQSWDGKTQESITNAYFGPDFTDKEIADELKANGLTFTQPENLAKEVAQLIFDGSVVARFSGRMEYGPRALGNRSIMYHAQEPEVNQWLNKRLGRTEFMPFAPVTLYEARERYFYNIKGAEHTAEFMTITFDCTDEMKRDCPAAVHIDGTARPQLIRREVNPGYYDIVKEYEKLSGISSLINTSFNMHEEPIVCNPHDAIRAFLDGNLDVLVIGPYLVISPIAA
ncbi:MAG: carbamoyltransferase [Gammaproteobacteria bacterium]|nr:carbamoyltransferase [Gammaproteobacteria bacterium]